MKNISIRIVALLLAVLLVVPVAVYSASADTTTLATYRKGYNNISSSYAGSQYYANFQKIPLTGDGRTDVLAVAMSQLGYMESNNSGDYSGNNGGSGNYTEYCYNMGPISSSYAYWWCATFCAWALLQSRCTDQSTMGAWCRNHQGDYNYIWREVSCAYWSTQLKGAGYFYYGKYRGGSYTPQPGDLIFFYSSDYVSHIGLVNYVQDGYVYTIEGNTGGDQGVVSNGGRVCAKSYALGSSYIYGYGALPYKKVNNEYTGIDYTGGTRTPGLYANPDKNKYMYSDEACTNSIGIINRYTMIEVTQVCSNGMLKATAVLDNGSTATGYINPNAGRVIQMTKSAPAEDPEKIALSELVNEALSLKALDYTNTQVMNVRSAYTNAVAVLNSSSSTTSDYKSAYNTLYAAIHDTYGIISVGKGYTATNTRSDSYADDGKRLTDGIKGDPNGGNSYTGWNEQADVVVDLGSNIASNTYTVYFAGGAWGIGSPNNSVTVNVSYSTDGTNYTPIGSSNQAILKKGTAIEGQDLWSTYELNIAGDKIYARYIKFNLVHKDGGHIWVDEIEVADYADPMLTDSFYVNGFNTAVQSGKCVVFTNGFGEITASTANHRWTTNVIATKQADGTFIVDEVFAGEGDGVKSVSLTEHQIMIAAHSWEGVDDAVAGSNHNAALLFSLKAGDIITFNGVTTALGYYDVLAYGTITQKTCSHSYSSVVTAPTCTAQGYTTHTCSLCGDSYVDNYVAAGHTAGEWETLADGSQEQRCSSCGALLDSKEAPEDTFITGDVNGDGKVNMFDYLIVKSAYFGKSELDDAAYVRADVNNDGKVNMFDYVIVKTYCF